MTISASGAGVTLRATLTVHPVGEPTSPSVSALDLGPTAVNGGNSSTGTVTLGSGTRTVSLE